MINPAQPFAPSCIRKTLVRPIFHLSLSVLLLLPVTTGRALADGPGTRPASAPAKVEITSKDGALTLKLASDWKQTQPINPDIILKALGPDNVQICVSSDKKMDVVSFDAFVKEGMKRYVASLQNPQATVPSTIKVNGQNAVRYEVTYDDGIYRWGTVVIYVESPTRYNAFTITGALSKFTDHKDEWAKLVNGLAENPAPKN